MRLSITLTLLILAVGGLLGWQDHQRLVVVRSTHAKLVAEAAAAGLHVAATGQDDGVRATKREREDKTAIAKNAAADFIAFARKIEAQEEKGGEPDEDMQQEILDFFDRMMALDASQLKTLIAEFRASSAIKDETRRNLIGFSIMTLGNDHPQAALMLFTESSDLIGSNGMGGHIATNTLTRWAKDDPLAALEWARSNGEKHPALVTDDAKRGIITGAAANDPKLAFSLISELGLKDSSEAVDSIADAAHSPEERSATLAALKDYLATITDPQAKEKAEMTVTSQLIRNAAKDGFDAATRWLDQSGMSPEQIDKLGGSLAHSIPSKETGRWIEWLATQVPAGKPAAGTRTLVSTWTQSDYRAAGTWLAATPAGPTRDTAVAEYAETVAKYEPETASKWALTLPAGKPREKTLNRIYQEWPKEDDASKAAAEAFADQHGIAR